MIPIDDNISNAQIKSLNMFCTGSQIAWVRVNVNATNFIVKGMDERFFFSFYSLRANSEWIWYGWGDGNIVITFIMTFYGDFSVELVGCVIEYRLFASQVILGWGATIAIRFELFAHFRYAPNIFRVGMVNGKEIVRVTHYSHLHMEHRFG